MIPVYVPCAACRGDGSVAGFDVHFAMLVVIQRCRACDGLGRQWAPGAPAYGCEVTLADREPGEVVTLGNGQRVKILWHMPRKRPKVTPETTFVDVLTEFYEAETFNAVPYPSCIGVARVDNPKVVADREAHDRDRVADPNDPVQRHAGALL